MHATGQKYKIKPTSESYPNDAHLKYPYDSKLKTILLDKNVQPGLLVKKFFQTVERFCVQDAKFKVYDSEELRTVILGREVCQSRKKKNIQIINSRTNQLSA